MRQWPHVVVPGQAACPIGCVAVASRLSGGAWPGRLPGATPAAAAGGHNDVVASYAVNPQAVAYARQLIDARQYVLDSDWGKVQPRAETQNDYLAKHGWAEYAGWHLGLTEGAGDETKARYAFVVGDFRRIHRSGLIASVYRAAEWRHKAVELAAHDLLQALDAAAGIT
jgi:hypothetical protein